jgi:hypothetical protein
VFVKDKSNIIDKAVNDIVGQLKVSGYDGSQNLVVEWAPTTVVSIEQNTATRFKGVLRDNMGKFNADITRNGKDVKIYFQGVGTRTMTLDQAQWEFDMMWECLAQQGHKVKVVS